ncbi:hypothetical protein [Bathymodiolus septemdierum thioautotrophic gill symbiont]|uniref:hypothetical protein n=1 Tax=Bathymodiolus septemdierum thioautotrophic gill symbiont TaxID=113267 RepID=UPI0012EE89F6|nr:hypothetical protein [Bathymodiolus septemdierum thioautotrophic gill symbiont]
MSNPAVAGSQAGDFVKVAGDIHEVIKTSPTAVADLVRLAGGTAGRGVFVLCE